jgi:hypothetical protein
MTAAHQGYPAARYEELWTHSPFSVATPDEPTTDSAEYSFVGYAQAQGGNGATISYVSLVQKQNQNHLLVSSDKPLGGLELKSVDKRSDGVYASLIQNGQPLTLKLELAQTGVQAAAIPNPNFTMPQNFGIPNGQNYQMPGAINPNTGRPFIRIRRPIIHVPTRTGIMPGQPPPPPSP